jgi:hypothetical protein
VSLLLGLILVESALLVLALAFLLALLRSHAEILRRLHALEPTAAGLPRHSPSAPGPGSAGARSLAAGPSSTPWPGSAGGDGASGTAPGELVGQTLDGDAVKLSFQTGAPRTLLAFLSSGCGACHGLWEGLRAGVALPGAIRLVIVTKGSERESPSRLRALAAQDHEVVMSTSAWEAFGVSATPHFALIDSADARILGRGTATSWQQILSLVGDAERDSSLARARTSAQRAARAEAALGAAGIGAGHPSLYPSRRRS